MPNDGLTISGGGSLAVGSDELIDRAQRLERFHDSAHAVVLQLRALDWLMTPSQLRLAKAPASATEAEGDLDAAIRLLDTAARRAGLVARAIRISMWFYGLAEHAQQRIMQHLADVVGYTLGAVGPLFIGPAIPVLLPAGAAVGASIAAAGSPGALLGEAKGWLNQHPGLLNNPATVTVITLATGAIDDVIMGGLHVPPGVAELLGDDGVRVSGIATAAGAVAAVGSGFGFFTESGVRVHPLGNSKKLSSAPTTYAGRIARLPVAAENGGAQIRVDRYSTPGKPDSFEVYLSGTQDFSPKGTTTPFDLGSNVRGVGGLPNGSLDAVEKALKQAGVTSKSPITFTGHSQGGLLAHELAASGRYNVQGVLEAGPPASQSRLPADVPEVVLAHETDIVTGLGASRSNDDAIVVSRNPFPDGNVPPGDAVTSHDTGRYRETAHLLDGAASEKVAAAKERMNSTSAGATSMTSTLFKAERLTGKH